jgi:GNAT superfamily N-acetyltransferase
MPVNRIMIRPLTPADGPAIDAVFAGMSPRSRYLRFHVPLQRMPGPVRRGLLRVDGRDRGALLAEVRSPMGQHAVGTAMFARTGEHEAEVAFAVVDAWQRHGVGRLLLDELGEWVQRLGYQRLHAMVLAENRAAHRLLTTAFPGSFTRWDDGIRRVECPLGTVEITDEDLLAALA